MNRFDLENRLVSFSVQIIELTKNLDNSYASKHLRNQIIRSSTSAALNYDEVQAGESRKDFIHKMKISLKGLRKSLVCLKIISKSKLSKNHTIVTKCIDESNQLVSIIVKSIDTTIKNRNSLIDILKFLFNEQTNNIQYHDGASSIISIQ